MTSSHACLRQTEEVEIETKKKKAQAITNQLYLDQFKASAELELEKERIKQDMEVLKKESRLRSKYYV